MWTPWRKERGVGAWDWSSSPGCFERHLVRRLNNPLFPPSMRIVTEREFRSAKTLDERDAGAFREAFAGHIEEGLRLRGKETLSYVGNYLKRTLELMERAAAIDGDWEQEMRVLEAAIDASKQFLNSHTEKEAAAVLERAIALHCLQIYNPFLAQSFRPDSPFPKTETNEWLRALLSEDEKTIENTATFAGGLGWDFMEQARTILREAVRDGLPPVEARRKLGILEAGYSKGAEM
jgi:hypothetical protein